MISQFKLLVVYTVKSDYYHVVTNIYLLTSKCQLTC